MFGGLHSGLADPAQALHRWLSKITQNINPTRGDSARKPRTMT